MDRDLAPTPFAQQIPRQYNAEISGSAQAHLGDLIGDVHHHHYAPLVGRTETLPTPSSTVPFRRDADYIDRGTLLTQIEQKFAEPAARVALVGIGGVGKSQLAIECCHCLRERSPETWVFWIYASTTDRVTQGFHDIAEEAEIPGRDDPQADVPELVRKWLRKEKRRWLIVLDNLDDDAVLMLRQEDESIESSHARAKQSRLLSDYMPQTPNGSLLITTRTVAVALQLVEQRDSIQIGPMTNTEAIALLARKLGSYPPDNDLPELAAVLEFMPLAIIQAAAYVQRKAPRCSIREYIKQFNQNDKARTGLLSYEAGHLRRDREARNSIINSWQTSFDYIRRKWPSSADLLSLMSFFDRQGIPEYVLTASVDPQQTSSDCNVGAESITFDADMSRLCDHSLVSAEVGGHTFAMHRPVQLATRDWLAQHGQDKTQRAKFLEKLSWIYPSASQENWARCEELHPHVVEAASVCPDRDSNDESLYHWGQILGCGARYALDRGHFDDAERMGQNSVRALEDVMPQHEADTAASWNTLAAVFERQGRLQQAEELTLKVIEMHGRIFGEDHPATLFYMTNLARIYINQDRSAEAEELQLEVLDKQKRIQGEDHFDTLTSALSLVIIYLEQGRFDIAERSQVPLLRVLRRTLGEHNIWTHDATSVLARIYLEQGRPKEAEVLCIQVLEASKRILGEDHPNTMTATNNLVYAYIEQRRFDEAETLLLPLYEKEKDMFGEENLYTLEAMYQLGIVLCEQGRLDEALELFASCLQLLERALIPTHSRTQLTSRWLAYCRASLAQQNSEQSSTAQSSIERSSTDHQSAPATPPEKVIGDVTIIKDN